MRRIDKLLLGVTALTLLILNPLESSAGLRIRYDGNGCNPMYGPWTAVGPNSQHGLRWTLANGANRGAACPIKTGGDYVNLGSGAEHEIDTVKMRFHQADNGGVATELVAHDYDDSDYCTCGLTQGDATGFFSRTMPFNCGSCSYASNWGVAVNVIPFSSGPLTLKMITVYDKDP